MSQFARRVTYAAIAVAAVFALLFGLSGGRLLGVTPSIDPLTPVGPTTSGTATTPVVLPPAPPLFKDADIEQIGLVLGPESERAADRIDAFYADQPAGRTVDDAAFVEWAAKQITGEPSAGQRSRERAQRADLNRSEKRDDAAAWLGVHGCRDVWAAYVVDQQQFHASGARAATDVELGEVLDLTARVAEAARTRFADDGDDRIAPCTPRPQPGPQDCGCSFPSSAAALSAAARTYLSALDPRGSRQYAWMERQVDEAGVYQGVELPSDVQAGSLLGYLAGRYYLTSKGYGNLLVGPAPTTTTATPARAAAPARANTDDDEDRE